MINHIQHELWISSVDLLAVSETIAPVKLNTLELFQI